MPQAARSGEWIIHGAAKSGYAFTRQKNARSATEFFVLSIGAGCELVRRLQRCA
jgi:hypothetical protein